VCLSSAASQAAWQELALIDVTLNPTTTAVMLDTNTEPLMV